MPEPIAEENCLSSNGGLFMTIEITITIIVLLIIAAFVVSYVLRKKHYQIVDELEEQKIQLTTLPIMEDIHKINAIKLTGQTEETFKKWQHSWEKVEKVSIPEIENHLFEAERAIDKLNLKYASDSEKQAQEKMQHTKTELTDIQAALQELVKSEEKNQAEFVKVKETYQVIRKKLLTQSFSFGPALDKVEHKLTSLESDFATFSEYTAQGDYIEAKSVLENVHQKADHLNDLIQKIPALFKVVSTEFVEQLKEIKTGYQLLKEDSFLFPDDHILEEVDKIEGRRTDVEMLIGNLEVEAAQEKIPAIADDIDHLYEKMEIEIAASEYVSENEPKLSELLAYLNRKNSKLLIEIDRISQSYKLTHNELQQTQNFKNQLEEITETADSYAKALQDGQIVFSEAKESYEANFEELNRIDKEQNEIAHYLQELRKEETVVKERLDDFEFNMRGMKRFIEKQHLPGLPTEYTELFFSVTHKIENLSQEINKLRIDMDEIKKMADYIDDDIDVLIKKTEDTVDAALLTEYMTQYANRYRQSNPQIASATKKSFELFNNEYNYREALETIATALEEVEPGAYKKVEDMYFNEVKANI